MAASSHGDVGEQVAPTPVPVCHSGKSPLVPNPAFSVAGDGLSLQVFEISENTCSYPTSCRLRGLTPRFPAPGQAPRCDRSKFCLLLAAGFERDLAQRPTGRRLRSLRGDRTDDEHAGARHKQHRSAGGAGLDFHPS
jgi:hypothetical protein